jgi:hypothetical protein
MGEGMAANKYSAFAPVGLKFRDERPFVVLRTLADVARILMQGWPLDDGEDYVVAIKACADALIGATSPEELRQALLLAAKEADISAFALVHDRNLEEAFSGDRLSVQG